MKGWYKYFFVAVLFVVTVNCQSVKTTETEEARPNIIYVLADDLGYGDISIYYPEGKISTPNLDALGAAGMIFTDAHTSSAVCTPTRYGIITGRYNWRSPLKSSVLTGNSKALIPQKRTTVASLLKKEGYETAFIGKWHLGWDWALKDPTVESGEGWDPGDFDNIDFSKKVGNSPNTLGFTYSYGHCGSLDMAPYVYVENGMPTMVPDSVTVSKTKYGWWRKGPTARDFDFDDVTPNFFRKSFGYIKEKAKGKSPFFLYLALPSPHTPILPTEEWQGKSDLLPYGDFMMMIDAYMGQLTAVIKEAGIEENTIVIFTSDNGCSPAAGIDEMMAKGHNPTGIYRGHKADIFEGGHRVPFMVKWPSKIKPDSQSDKTICTTDLMATCAEIVGVDLKDSEGEDSFSMLPLFNNPTSPDYKREATVHHSINGSFAIRKDNWKMIFCPGSGGWSAPKPNSEGIGDLPKFQLYDLSKDPQEKNNVYGQFHDVESALTRLMVSYIENGRSNPGEKQKNDPDGYGSKEWKQLEVFYN
ncbi:arylsulfatase [Arenibacter sp. F20364]|uniref:sulfatase family protein n=1 Tax=Arenibacter sp. F20364 TaxID=2926415 RepID=UPI001FF63D8C|nr:arylsulfatase [Arenibacter sp. F20364]MCK0190909.1 arylsulfatase [Arenibacter sp. F20364]